MSDDVNFFEMETFMELLYADKILFIDFSKAIYSFI